MVAIRRRIFLALFSLLFFGGLAFADSPVVQIHFEYSEELDEFHILDIQTLYSYVSPDIDPGNASLRVLDAQGKTLHSVRIGLTRQTLVVTPPADANANTETVDGKTEITANSTWVGVPYSEEIHSIEIEPDNNAGVFTLEIGERLCNGDGKCNGDETSLSCTDCKPDEEDGVCVWEEDGYCDPDCYEGVDPDCIEEEPEETPVETPQETALPEKTPEKGEKGGTEQQGIDYTYIAIAAVLVALVLLVFYLKKERG